MLTAIRKLMDIYLDKYKMGVLCVKGMTFSVKVSKR